MVPTYGTPPDLVQGFIAGGDAALRRSVEASEDDPEAGAQAVQKVDVGEADVVVGIAASGNTPWVLGAVTEAQRRGAATIALTCNPDSPLARLADLVIAPAVGPEVIAGSSRMKAGTAQKMVLNMLSTATMIRLGKVYGNLMVDVQPTSAKLRQRARRIVASACDLSMEEAAALLADCDGETKTAIVVGLTGVAPDEARRRLARAGGRVRAALGPGRGQPADRPR
jgi:N-acetylmuramic acid 6-phosphate etherase